MSTVALAQQLNHMGDEWIWKMWYRQYNVVLFQIENIGILSYATLMDLEVSMLSKTRQLQTINPERILILEEAKLTEASSKTEAVRD